MSLYIFSFVVTLHFQSCPERLILRHRSGACKENTTQLPAPQHPRMFRLQSKRAHMFLFSRRPAASVSWPLNELQNQKPRQVYAVKIVYLATGPITISSGSRHGLFLTSDFICLSCIVFWVLQSPPGAYILLFLKQKGKFLALLVAEGEKTQN